MRLLTLEQFCKEPIGTLFSEFKGDELDSVLQVKLDYYLRDGKPAFNGTGYVAPVYESVNGEYCGRPDNLALDNKTETFSVDTTDYDYKKTDKFLVYNKDEIKQMIKILEYSLNRTENGCWE